MPTPKQGYHLADGSECPGTTTITSRYDEKEGLIFWAYEKGKKAGLAGLSKARLYDKTEEADIGTHVHAMVLEDLHGRALPSFPPAFTFQMQLAANNSFTNYKEQLARRKAFFMPLEIQLVSQKYRYGGTPDAVEEFDGIVDGCDWKSGKDVYLGYLVQGGAYRNLWNENHPDMPMRGFRIYIFKKDTGAFSEHYYGPETMDVAFELFVKWREAWEIDKKLKRLV